MRRGTQTGRSTWAGLVCKATDDGDAQFNCGVVYSGDRGVAKDAAKARDYWQKAADQGGIGAGIGALAGWRNASAELTQARARSAARVADALELAEAERSVAVAQRDVDRARGRVVPRRRRHPRLRCTLARNLDE